MIEQFHRPASLHEALLLKAELGDDAMFLAGGTLINGLGFPWVPAQLISLAGLGLDAIEQQGTVLRIGACCTIQALLDSPLPDQSLRRAAALVVNRNVRNCATLGGHVAANKSCADLIPTLLVLDAQVELRSAEGVLTLALDDYLQARRPELITALLVPQVPACRAATQLNHIRTAADMSLVTAAASLERVESLLRSVRLAVGGVAARVLRLPQIERALEGQALPPREELEAMVASQVSPIDDHRGSADFKRHIASVLAASCLHAAWQEADTCN